MDYYGIGQVRRFCPTLTEHKLRRACELGLIDSRRSDGGRWQISAEGVEVLKRDGIPPLPVRAEAAESEPAEKEAPARTQAAPPARRDRALDESDEAPEVQAEITRYHATVQRARRKSAELDEADVDDQMTERKRRQAQERQVKQEEEQQRTAHVKRKEWEEFHINAFLHHQGLIRVLPAEQLAAVLPALQSALKMSPTGSSAEVVEKLLLTAGKKALMPFWCHARREKAISAAVECLPFSAPADYRIRAKRLAVEAVSSLEEDTSAEEFALVAEQAVEGVVREYEHNEKLQDALGNVTLLGATSVEVSRAKREVEAELKKAPRGSSIQELNEIAEEIQGRHRNAVELRQAKEKGLADALNYISEYLRDSDDFEWDYSMEWYFKAEELKKTLRPLLIERQNTGHGKPAQLRRFIREYISQETEDSDDAD